MNLPTMPERIEYSCTICGHAMTPSEAWVIWLPHDDCRYRCEQHRENGHRARSR